MTNILVKFFVSVFMIFQFSFAMSSTTTGSELIGGAFRMENQDGKKVTEKDFYGKYSLVFFGFTNCPTVCPLGLSTMGRVVYKLPASLKKQLQPIFVTVDPKRDTGVKIKKFIKAFGTNFIGLRGTKENTKDMVKKYRGYYSKYYEDDSEDDDDYLMDHSDVIYLMDKNGKYLTHFSSSKKINEIVNTVSDFINKKNKK